LWERAFAARIRAMEKIRAARLLVHALRRHGVERIFGLCGDHVNSIFNACAGGGGAVAATIARGQGAASA
jgi:thiamine pyrophosphate-dependent acetolactate synthase large subunit-like protein